MMYIGYLLNASKHAEPIKSALKYGLLPPHHKSKSHSNKINIDEFISSIKRFSAGLLHDKLPNEDLFVWVAGQTKDVHGTIGSHQGMIICLSNAALIIIDALEKTRHFSHLNRNQIDSILDIKSTFASQAKKAIAIESARDFKDLRKITMSSLATDHDKQKVETTVQAAEKIIQMGNEQSLEQNMTSLLFRFRDLARATKTDTNNYRSLIPIAKAAEAGLFLKKLYLDGILTDEQKTIFSESLSMRLVLANADPIWRKPEWIAWCADYGREMPLGKQRADTAVLECSLREHKNFLNDSNNKDYNRFKSKGWMFLEHRAGDSRIMFAGKGIDIKSREDKIIKPQIWTVAKVYQSPKLHTTKSYVEDIIKCLKSMEDIKETLFIDDNT